MMFWLTTLVVLLLCRHYTLYEFSFMLGGIGLAIPAAEAFNAMLQFLFRPKELPMIDAVKAGHDDPAKVAEVQKYLETHPEAKAKLEKLGITKLDPDKIQAILQFIMLVLGLFKKPAAAILFLLLLAASASAQYRAPAIHGYYTPPVVITWEEWQEFQAWKKAKQQAVLVAVEAPQQQVQYFSSLPLTFNQSQISAGGDCANGSCGQPSAGRSGFLGRRR